MLVTLSDWTRNWRRGSRDLKVVLMIALLAASVAAAVVIILWTSTRQYVPLYGKQELYDKANILELLEKMNFSYRLDSGSGDVLVRDDQLAQARMGLAAQGIRAALPAGLEGLDKLSALGTSQFMESARYLHAVEGELARTIIALDGVRSARVHIARPERTLFVGRTEQKPTASVMVDLAGGRTLDSDQVEAIVNLVAGSIPGMALESVAVIDQSGQLLSAGLFDKQGLGRLSLQQLDYVRRLEQLIAQRASDMLYPVLGADNFRVQVAAELDFSSVEETRKTLDDTPVLVRESSILESDIDALAMGIPGALSNRPPVAENPEADGEEAGEQAAESTRRREQMDSHFEIGSAVTHTRQQQARLRNMSVSVLLNSNLAPEGGWPPAELDSLADMLQRAVGFNAMRGDEFSLASFSFTTQATAAADAQPLQWWHDPIWQNYLRYIIGALLVLTLIQVGIRPLVQHLVRTPNREVLPQKGARMIGAEDYGSNDMEVRLAGTGAVALPGVDETAQLADLPPPGSELELQLKHLRLLADKETARVTEVIKQWTHNHAE